MLNLSESEMLTLIKLCNLPKTGLKIWKEGKKDRHLYNRMEGRQFKAL